jgi:hypothetical protein
MELIFGQEACFLERTPQLCIVIEVALVSNMLFTIMHVTYKFESVKVTLYGK